jgi:hypothetical protein
MLTNIKVSILHRAGLLIVLLLFFFSIACYETPRGTRTFYGLTPPVKQTVQTEEFCNSLALPLESVFLESRIQSKRESGVVTNIYSTEKSCNEINLFFRDMLIHKGWQLVEAERGSYFPSIFETHYKFELNPNELGVSCNDLKDYRGTKRFYVSCVWN